MEFGWKNILHIIFNFAAYMKGAYISPEGPLT